MVLAEDRIPFAGTFRDHHLRNTNRQLQFSRRVLRAGKVDFSYCQEFAFRFDAHGQENERFEEQGKGRIWVKLKR